MLTYTYISKGKFGLVEKPKPMIQHESDAIVKVTLASICSSDLHINHGSVPRAVEGITVGHEMVGIVEEVGSAVTHVKPGDTAVFKGEYQELGNKIVSKALDDRAGCAILIELIRSELEYDAWFSFSVQEEIGTRGAQTAAFTVAPDYAIVVETTTAADISGVKDEKRVCICGEGGTVSFMDRSTLYDRELFDKAFEIAEKKSIR